MLRLRIPSMPHPRADYSCLTRVISWCAPLLIAAAKLLNAARSLTTASAHFPTDKCNHVSQLSLLQLFIRRAHITFLKQLKRRHPASAMPKASPVKRQRASFACDFCHTRGLKCRRTAQSVDDDDAIDSDASCLTCLDYGVTCTVNRPVRKRGRKPRIASQGKESELSSDANSQIWSLQTIRRLVRIYRDTMYQC